MIKHFFWCPNHGQQETALVQADDVARCNVCRRPVEAMVGDPLPPPGKGGPLDGGTPWEDPFDGLLNGIRFVLAPSTGHVIHWQAYVIDPAQPDPCIDPHLHATGGLVPSYVDPLAACGVAGPYRRPTDMRDEPCWGCRENVTRAIRDCRARLLRLQGRPL